MKSTVRYSTTDNKPISIDKYVSSEEEKNKLSNKALMLMRSNNLALANSNKAYKEKILEFNNYLRDKDIHHILNVLRSLITK